MGVHLRNRRLLADQTQRQAAAQMGLLREVYDRWVRDETEPPVGFWKRIIDFLGHYPTRSMAKERPMSSRWHDVFRDSVNTR